MKIDKSYFIGDLAIEGLNTGCSPAATEGILDMQFSGYIAKHEPDYLLKILGCSLFVDLAAYCELTDNGSANDWKHKLVIATNGTAPVEDEAFSEWLRTIGEKNNVKERKFDIVCELLFSKYHSPVANYVYFQAVRHRHVVISSLGSTTAESNSVSPNYKLCLAWNSMAQMNLDLHRYLLSNDSYYHGYVPCMDMFRTINLMGI